MTPAEGSKTVFAEQRVARALIAISTLVVVIRLSVLRAPTFRDEGLFGYIGQELLRGHLPLETVLDNKGPLLFTWYAAALALFGESSIEGIRLVGILFVLAFLAVFYLLARDLKDERYALFSVSLFALHASLVKIQSFYYGTELFTLLPMTLSGWLSWRAVSQRSLPKAFLAGLFLGLAAWTRLTALTLVLSYAGFMALACVGRRRLLFPLAFGLGMIAASIPFLAVYSSRGQLGVLHEAFFTFSAVQATIGDAFSSQSDQLISVARVVLPSTIVLWVLAIGGCVGVVMRCLERNARLFVWLWLLGAVIGFLGPMHFAIKQLFLVYPPVCLSAASTLTALVDRAKNQKNNARTVLLALFGMGLIVEVGLNVPEHIRLMRGDPSASQPIIVKGEQLSAWLRANSTPDDTIYNYGVEWELYLRSGRRAPTRQVSALFLVSLGVAVDRGAPLAEEFASVQKEVVTAFERTPPKFFILTAGLKNYDLASFTLPAYLEDQLRTRYELLFHDEPYWVFRRLAPSPAAKAQKSKSANSSTQ